MDTIPVARAILRKAVSKLGGIEPAAAQLGVAPSLLMRFLDGRITVPDIVLLRAVDIVLDDLPVIHSGGPQGGGSQPFNRSPK